MSDGPDYNHYSPSELFEAYHSIDRNSYPQRFRELCGIMEGQGLLVKTDNAYELTEKAHTPPKIFEYQEQSIPSYTCLPPEPQYDDEGNYISNEIPLKNRVTNSLLSLGIIIYGGYGLYIDELWMPLARRTIIVLSGFSAMLMFVAILCASAMMIAEVVDHYDKRDNEHNYYKVALVFKNIACAGFGVAVVVGLFMGARIE